MAQLDAIVIGGGAAGLMCALTAGQRGRRVLLLEHGQEVGAKILISGGGRCNFTNREAQAKRFISANPDFCRSALARYTQADFVALVEKHGIAHYEKTLGQLFCEGTGAAKKIVKLLLDECAAGHVQVKTGVRPQSISRGDMFRVETDAGVFEAPALVMATGGLSIPKLGATDFAYRWAKKFGLKLIEPRPGLVPLTFSADDLALMRPLSGVSLHVIAKAGGAAFREAALFTHRGLSGPAILQASSYWRAGEAITLDLAPDHGADFLVEKKRARPKAGLKSVLAEVLPARLAEALGERLPEGNLADIKDQALLDAARMIKAWEIFPTGTEGYAKAEVTVGGVDVNGLSQKTMEAREVPGLFVIGEAADVTGWLGGYNFQWAWSSGWCAGQAL